MKGFEKRQRTAWSSRKNTERGGDPCESVDSYKRLDPKSAGNRNLADESIQPGRILIVCKREIDSVFMAACLEMSHSEQQALKAWLSHQPRPGSPVCGSQSSRELPCSLNKAVSVPPSGAVHGGNLHTIVSYFVCTSAPESWKRLK
ncbi:uncharacterized [Tachysurus ichikawai]